MEKKLPYVCLEYWMPQKYLPVRFSQIISFSVTAIQQKQRQQQQAFACETYSGRVFYNKPPPPNKGFISDDSKKGFCQPIDPIFFA